jgi:hypothetical protein
LVLCWNAYNQIFELLTVSHGLFPHQYSPKNEEDDELDLDLTMFDSEDGESFDPDDCYHHIKKMSTSIQIFSVFITSFIIIN